jgi:hypothetical protein
MRERHVADAERRVHAQQPQIVVDHVAAFPAHQRGDRVIRGRLPHIRGGRREHQILGMRADRFAHGVDLIERALHGRRTGDIARHSDREEQRVQARSRIRGMSMLPFGFRLPMSKALSKIVVLTLATQGDDRVHSGRAPRRDVARQKYNDHEDHRHSDKHFRIKRSHSVEQT